MGSGGGISTASLGPVLPRCVRRVWRPVVDGDGAANGTALTGVGAAADAAPRALVGAGGRDDHMSPPAAATGGVAVLPGSRLDGPWGDTARWNLIAGVKGVDVTPPTASVVPVDKDTPNVSKHSGTGVLSTTCDHGVAWQGIT